LVLINLVPELPVPTLTMFILKARTIKNYSSSSFDFDFGFDFGLSSNSGYLSSMSLAARVLPLKR